jgi:hypothetical protein
MTVYWGRVIIGAFLLEAVLSAVLLPVRLVSIIAFLSSQSGPSSSVTS